MIPLRKTWDRFWFSGEPPENLDLIRITLGVAMFVSFGASSGGFFEFYGNEGWVPLGSSFFTQRWQWMALHAVFLVSLGAFAVGLGTRWVKWVVLAIHLIYMRRNPAILYGADVLAQNLLVILAVAPIGGNFSLDRYLASRMSGTTKRDVRESPVDPRWASACIRLVQVLMVVVFLSSGLWKLKNEAWWSGDAVWISMTRFEFMNGAFMWLAHSHSLLNVISYAALALEISYPFFIWREASRPYFLFGAVMLHILIATVLGLRYFSAVAIAGHLSFLRAMDLAFFKLKSHTLSDLVSNDQKGTR